AIYAEPEGNLAGWRALVGWLEAGDATGIEGLVRVLELRDEATVARIASARRKRAAKPKGTKR
ncbi:MAG: hypothetical protein RIF41_27230, partial [Polyangiaceae bacterium]